MHIVHTLHDPSYTATASPALPETQDLLDASEMAVIASCNRASGTTDSNAPLRIRRGSNCISQRTT